MKPVFWKFPGAAAAFILVLGATLAIAHAQVNQPNPNVGDPFNPPPNAVAWKVVNIDIGDEHGPFALPGKPNPNSYPVLDPAVFFWSSPDLCPYLHKHGFFPPPPLSDAHSDPAKSAKDDPGHEDYRYMAMVNHSVLDGQSDTDTVDDVCPHSVAPPYRPDPNPDGTLKDKGCGKKKADNTFGADVLTDVVDKR
jgi:hypothetical protein